MGEPVCAATDGLGLGNLVSFFGFAPSEIVRPRVRLKARRPGRRARPAALRFFCIAQCGTVPPPFNWNVRRRATCRTVV